MDRRGRGSGGLTIVGNFFLMGRVDFGRLIDSSSMISTGKKADSDDLSVWQNHLVSISTETSPSFCDSSRKCAKYVEVPSSPRDPSRSDLLTSSCSSKINKIIQVHRASDLVFCQCLYLRVGARTNVKLKKIQCHDFDRIIFIWNNGRS